MLSMCRELDIPQLDYILSLIITQRVVIRHRDWTIPGSKQDRPLALEGHVSGLFTAVCLT